MSELNISRRKILAALGGAAGYFGANIENQYDYIYSSAVKLKPKNINFAFDFGATGDGLHDDSSSIQKAIDESASSGGGVVYLHGHHKVSESIFMRSNVCLYSPSPHHSKLIASDKFNEHLVRAESINNFSLIGLSIDHNGNNQKANNKNAINIVGSRDFFIENLFISNANNSGILIGDIDETIGSQDGFISSVIVKNAINGHGVVVDRAERIKFGLIDVTEPKKSGLQMYLSDHCSVNSLNVRADFHPDEGYAALRITASKEDAVGNVISNLISTGMCRGMFLGDNAKCNSISNFFIRSAGRDGIYLSNSSLNNISNGTIHNVSNSKDYHYSGIRIYNSKYNNFDNISITSPDSSMKFSIEEISSDECRINNKYSSMRLYKGQFGSVKACQGSVFSSCYDNEETSIINSSSELTLTSVENFHIVEGNTSINQILGGWRGREISIKFKSDLIINHGLGINIKLNENRKVRSGEVISFIHDGTDWYET